MYLAANTQALQRALHHLLLLPLKSSHTPEAFLKFYVICSYFIVRFTSNIKATICLLQSSNNLNLMRFVVLLFCYSAMSCRSSIANVIQCSQKRGCELSEDVQKRHAGFEIECKKIWSPSRVGIFFGHCCCASSLNIAVSGVTLRNDNLFQCLYNCTYNITQYRRKYYRMIVIN